MIGGFGVLIVDQESAVRASHPIHGVGFLSVIEAAVPGEPLETNSI